MKFVPKPAKVLNTADLRGAMTVEPGTFGTLRELNRLRVVDALRRAGTASRSDLARMTGISRTTVATLVSDLQTRGLIVEQADGRAEPTGRGRPPVLLRLDAAAGSALGVDFGHRHVRVAVADLSSAVLAERFVELDVDEAPEDALDAAADLASTVLAEAGVDRSRVIGAGMALSAPIDRHQGVVGSTVLPSWAGIQAGEELSRRLEIPVELDNDANLGALAEVSFGAGRGFSDVVYVMMSSGVGAGLLLGGRLYHGVDRHRRRAGTRSGATRGRHLPLRKPRLPGDGRLERRTPFASPPHTRPRADAPRHARPRGGGRPRREACGQ